MNNLKFSLADLTPFGRNLHRPECVLCTKSGNLYVSDWRGGVTRIANDGQQEAFLSKDPSIDLKPNGIALDRDGSFLIANLGDDGGIWRLERDGTLRPVLLDIDGVSLPPSNFVLIDRKGRIWITVSTRRVPRALGYRPDIDDGFIVLLDDRGPRIVADGLGYTNEIQFDASEEWLYVNETFGRRLSRFRIGTDGSLSGKETVTTFGYGVYPDGLAFDEEGGIWITSIVSNSVICISPDGSQQAVLRDAEPEHVKEVEEAFLSGRMDRPHLDNIESKKLRNISSLAFGGPDLRTACLGCLLGDSIMTFRSPIPGRRPFHWELD
jgi:sugar lactone lactonase YvrE